VVNEVHRVVVVFFNAGGKQKYWGHVFGRKTDLIDHPVGVSQISTLRW
jgi:hypothetical protein